MGFRSTFTIEDYAIVWPEWFRTKWAPYCWFSADNRGVFAPKCEGKIDGRWSALPLDIQRAVPWDALSIDHIVLVYLHECGGITRCQISAEAINWSEPAGWRKTPAATHIYCYGCSDWAVAT